MKIHACRLDRSIFEIKLVFWNENLDWHLLAQQEHKSHLQKLYLTAAQRCKRGARNLFIQKVCLQVLWLRGGYTRTLLPHSRNAMTYDSQVLMKSWCSFGRAR